MITITIMAMDRIITITIDGNAMNEFNDAPGRKNATAPTIQRAKFYGVGVGPGDPELITLKAVRVLQAVDRVYHPAGQSAVRSYVRAILASIAIPEAKCREVTLCMSRDRASVQESYERVSVQIIDNLRSGLSVAWATEGDPMLYSTFIWILDLVRRQRDIAIEIISGISSIQAVAARTAMPLARLDECVAVVPALYGLSRLSDLIEEFSTVCLLKVASVMDLLIDALACLTVPVRSVFAENVGTPTERIVWDLAALRGQKLPYFSMVIVARQPE